MIIFVTLWSLLKWVVILKAAGALVKVIMSVISTHQIKLSLSVYFICSYLSFFVLVWTCKMITSVILISSFQLLNWPGFSMHVGSTTNNRPRILPCDSFLFQEWHVRLWVVNVDPVALSFVENPSIGLTPFDVFCWGLTLGKKWKYWHTFKTWI